MRRLPLLLASLLLLPAAASAQVDVTPMRALSVGSSPSDPSGSSVRLKDLGTSGGTYVLLGDASDGGNIRARLLGRGDLPSTVGYTDEAETWSLLQTFSSGLTSNGLLTIGGSNDLLLGTGGMRVASGSIKLRNIADSADIASFGDASIALHQLTTTAAGIRSSHYASQTTGWGITHAGAADFRYLYVDEMHAKSFIADLESALNGGQIITKSSVILAQDFECPAAGGTATLWVRDFPGHGNMRVFAANDWVVLRAFTRSDADNDGHTDLTIADCVGQVSSYTDGSSGTEGTQSWTFTRGSGGNAGAMSSGTTIGADAIVLNHGVSGTGYLEASAIDGSEGAHSPYWQLVTWTTSPVAANRSLRARWGNLNGSYGYSAKTYGVAFGNPSDVHLTIDDSNGIRLHEGGVVRGQWYVDGTIQVGTAGSGEGNIRIASNAIRLRSGTVDRLVLGASNGELAFLDPSGTQRATISSSGAIFGRVATGEGNILADTSGNLYLRSGTTNRITLQASNGEINIVDPGGTPRTTIGSGYAAFGRVATGEPNVWIASGALSIRSGTTTRIGLDASNGAIRMYDAAGTMRAYLGDRGGGVYGLLLGNSGTAGQTYIDIRSDGDMMFCAAGTACTLTFSGATGSITSLGSIAIGSGGHIRGGATAYASGTGFWLGNDSGTYKLRVGTTSGNRLTWDGSSLTVVGNGAGLIDLDGGHIQAGTITADAIKAGTITANEIASGTITATQIATGTITADRLNVSSLSALSANLGTITAGSISIGAGDHQTTITSTGALTARSPTFEGSAIFEGGVVFDGPVISVVNIVRSVLRLGALAGGGTRHLCVDNDGQVGPCP